MGEVAETVITVKNQTSVPKAVMLFLGLKAKDKIVWRIEDGKVYIEKRTQ
jgi:bifunctional DNA-binding transcriptional regulator/antitoxin component of YhaV-PrlF toxin-antitoxin module